MVGGASDISIGSDGSVYVIANVSCCTGGSSIWHYVNGTWTQLPGAGVRIAASWDTGTYPGGIGPGRLLRNDAAGHDLLLQSVIRLYAAHGRRGASRSHE